VVFPTATTPGCELANAARSASRSPARIHGQLVYCGSSTRTDASSKETATESCRVAPGTSSKTGGTPCIEAVSAWMLASETATGADPECPWYATATLVLPGATASTVGPAPIVATDVSALEVVA
jgi:hypothetical protein